MNKNEPSLNRILLTFLLLFLVYLLFAYQLYIALAGYVAIATIFLIITNFKNVENSFRTFSQERRKISNLKYYYITDDNKVNDIEMRKKTYNFLRNMSKSVYTVIVFNICASYFLLINLFGNHQLFEMLLILMLTLMFLLRFSGSLIIFIYKYTTTAYILVPIICFLLCLIVNDSINLNLPIFVYFGFFISIVSIGYLLFSVLCPVHILRKLNGRTVLISSFITIVTLFVVQISSYYFTNSQILNSYLLTIENVEDATDISIMLKSLIIDNPGLIKVTNYFLEKEMIAQVTSLVNLTTAGISISFIIGALFITRKIKINDRKAKKIYREIIKDHSLINYNILIKCSFHGGEEYENLILNNTVMHQHVIFFEEGITVPDITRKKRFFKWLENYSITYNFVLGLKSGLTKKDMD